jgi:hypothetical protein
MSLDRMPAALRQQIEDDVQPVRPLHPAWQRSLVVALVATFAMAATVLGLKLQLRSDLGMLPVWLGWGCTAVELVVGVLIIGLALREAVPGSSPPTGLERTAVATGLAIQILVGIATWMHSPGLPLGTDWFAKSIGCLVHDLALVGPTMVITLWLVFRALPLRAPIAGLLGGVGAAMIGDAVIHLLCPMSDLRHVLVWHTGAVFAFMALGWLSGMAWERLRWR